MSGANIRTMTRADLDTVLDWAAAEGWNPGLDDAEAFFAADPEGFLVAEMDAQPIASLSIVRAGPVAFLGLYLCRPEWRGQGHGFALWREGLARLAPEGVSVGLDGVPDQQDNYARSGFVRSHRTIRHTGPLKPDGPDPTRPLVPGDLPAALALDRAVTGVDRSAFLADWLTGTPRRMTRVLEREGRLGGIATLRACRSGWKVGPLLAEDAVAAADLLQGLAPIAGGAPVSLDVPEPNAAAVALARSHAMEPAFETARMWRGPAPEQDLSRTFGVATLELG